MNLESPCVRVCVIDPGTGFCIGCQRTLDEISHWVAMSDAERDAVRNALAARRTKWTPLRCERCGAGFACGAADRENACWCVRYPAIDSPQAGKSCLCPDCLSTMTRTKAHG